MRETYFSLNSVLRVFLVFLSFLASSSAYSVTLDEAKRNLPESIKSSGTIRVAVYLQWAPFGYVDEKGQPTGIDVELAKLLGRKLGLTVQLNDIGSASIIPGVSSGRFDMSAAQLSITEEREKVVDFVPYFKNDWNLLTKKGAPSIDINNLCGHTLAVTQGSAQALMIDRISDNCLATTGKKVNTIYFKDGAQSYLAVANGRGDGFIAAKAVGLYLSKHNHNLDVSKDVLRGYSVLCGIAVNKNLPKLKEALSVALSEAMMDGSYQALLKKYGVPESAYTSQ